MSRVPSWLQLEPFEEYEDPDAAPSADCGLEPAPRWSVHRARQNRLSMYLFGLLFMIIAVATIWDPALGAVQLTLRLLPVLILSVLYVGCAFVCDARLAVRFVYLAAFAAVVTSTASFLDVYASIFGVYLAIMTVTLIPWRISRLLICGLSFVLILLGVITEVWTPILIGMIAVGIAWAVGVAMEQGRVSNKLHRAEQRASALAVSAERERIARDLHDILGHSLTAISIKSELAGRLVDAESAGAKAQMGEVEAIARQALADVRATASAMRQVRLAIEVASARSVLTASGIEARVPTAIEPMSATTSEVLGYVVREAVTNVVRHSRADRCVITAGPDWVEVSDDGSGFDPAALRSGSGLEGLRHRVESAGGTLTVRRGPAGGMQVRAEGLAQSESGAESGPVVGRTRLDQAVPATGSAIGSSG